jgi:hypothetical protein
MTNVLAVTERELLEKRNVLLAALFTGVLPLLMPLLPWVGAGNGADARNIVALWAAVAFAGGVALTYGASMIARDLRERRMGFYFARPLTGASLWWGKVLAGLILIAGSAALALAPTAVVGRGSVLRWLASPEWTWVPICVVAILLVSHVVAVMVTSRTARLLAVDLVAASVLAGVTAFCLRQVFMTRAENLTIVVVSSLTAALLGCLLVTGAVGVARGRTDPRRNHVAHSMTLWGLLAAVVTSLAGYTAFLLHPTPSSLRSVDVISLPRQGSWLEVGGRSSGRGDYQAGFLLDMTSGRFVRLGTLRPWDMPVDISADASTAAWLQADGDPNLAPAQVMTLDLKAVSSRPRTTTIILPPGRRRDLALSPDGTRLAVRDKELVSVFQLGDGRVLASVRLTAQGWARLNFVDKELLRVTQIRETKPGEPPETRIYRLELPGGALTETGRVTGRSWAAQAVASDVPGRAMLVRSWSSDSARITLHDPWTGAQVRSLCSAGRDAILTPAFLSGDRLGVGEAVAGGARLRVFDANGEPVHTYELGKGYRVIIGGEVAPGLLALAVVRQQDVESWYKAEGLLLDLATGQSRSLGLGVVPAFRSWWFWNGRPAEPGSPASRLFRTSTGALAELDPATGRLRTILDTRWDE